MERPISIPFMDRIRYIGYGLLAGIVVGAFFGWWFHAWVGFIVKLFFVALFLIPLVAAIIFWRRVTSTKSSTPPTVRDADWVEIESASRSRR
jgi:F0F1-type ATP synthase assembly protein I